MKLYSYFRSSAAFRVRIALNLKGLSYETDAIHLVKNEQRSAEYQALNPSCLVPTLVDEDQAFLQSLSILEYLEERYPDTSLLPKNLIERAKVRAFSQAIASDIHPLNNLKVLKYLQNELDLNDEQKSHWYKHWILEGFHSLEAQLQASNGKFCFGERPSFADCCLIPQVYNAKRFKVDLTAFPKIESIYQYCLTLPAFLHAAPEQQADWE